MKIAKGNLWVDHAKAEELDVEKSYINKSQMII